MARRASAIPISTYG